MVKARSIAQGGAALTLAVLLAACGSSSAGNASGAAGSAVASTTAGPASSSAATTGSTAVSTSSAGSPAATTPLPAPTSAYSSKLKVIVSEAGNGTTLTVKRGADVIVELHSTYWQFQPASAPKVLVQALPEIQGDPPSRAGIPGSGKGTVRETYHARAAGTATITASRTTCGEALHCTVAQSIYRITVIVQ